MDFNKYTNKLKYPTKRGNTVKRYFDKVERTEVVADSGNDEFANSLHRYVYIDSVLSKDFESQRDLYNEETERLSRLFKYDTFLELGVPVNEATEKFFEYANRKYGSDGISAIFYNFEDLIELYIATEKYFKSGRV